MNRPLPFATLLIALLLATGCARIAYERERPINKAYKTFKAGTTDYDKVMQTLGPPPRLSATPTGFVFLYEHVAVEEKQLGVTFEELFDTLGLSLSAGGGSTLAGLVRLLYAWAEADIETLLVTFDHAGALQTVAYEDANRDLGSTIGLSFIFAAERKLGIEDFQAEPSPLDWGLAFTESVPRQLDRPQDTSTSQSGLKRRPTNFSVGQDVTIPQSKLKKRREKIEERR